MINNSIDYRGIKVDKMALEFDKEMVDNYIDKLYQPERLSPEDDKIIWSSVLDEYPYKPIICDSPNTANK